LAFSEIMESGERERLLSDASLNSFAGSSGSTAEDELRRKLKYFFMNPCQKFVAKRRLPWKLLLQLVKVVLVTVQLIVFGTSRASHIDFLETSEIAFKHLYLKDWTPSYETMPYPPAMGTYAVYTIGDFYDAVNFVLDRYNKTESIAIGTYHFTLPNNTMEPIQLCKNFYEQGVIWAFNESFVFDSTQDTDCFPMHPVEINGTLKYDTRQFLEVVNKSINFDRLIKVWLQFSLKTIHLKSLSKVNTPDCYQFDIVILFDNADHNGQMAVTLDSDEQVLTCNGVVTYSADDDQLGNVMVTVFDAIVMIISILSIVLCSRSILGAVDLMKVLSQIESLANPAVLFLLLSQHYDYQIQVTGPLKIMVIVN
jgi:mucolipin 3